MKHIKFAAVMILLIIGTSIGCAEEYSQRWNAYLQRTEYYDSFGTLVAYAQYNQVTKKLEYYDAWGNFLKSEEENPVTGNIESRDTWTGKMNYQRTQDPLTKNRENITDEFGRLIGYRVYMEELKKWVVYNNQHQQIGYYQWNVVTKSWDYYNGPAF